MVMTIYRNGDDNVMMRRRRHLGICGYCREANTPHFHQHWLPDDDVRGDDDDRDDRMIMVIINIKVPSLFS